MFEFYNDPQQVEPVGYCERCGGELYSNMEQDEDGYIFCERCRKEKEHETEKAETVLEVLEAVDSELKKYLSQDICNEVWNKMVTRFKVG